MSKLNSVAPFSMVPRQLLRAKGLSPSEYKLLMIILSYCNHAIGQNICWSRQQSLANDMECSRRQVIRLLKSLESKNYIVIHENFKENKQTSNVYEIPLHYFTHELDLDKYKDQIKKNAESDEEIRGDIFEDSDEIRGDIFEDSENNGDTDVTINGDTDVTQKETRERKLVSYSYNGNMGTNAREEFRYDNVVDFSEKEIEQVKNKAGKNEMSNEWVREAGAKFAHKFAHNVFYNKKTFMDSFAKLLTTEPTHTPYSDASPQNKQTNKQNNFYKNSGFATSGAYTTAGHGNNTSLRAQEILNRGAARAREATKQHDARLSDYFDRTLGKND